MRPARKARGGHIPGVCNRRATQRPGMQRRPNVTGLRRRDTRPNSDRGVLRRSFVPPRAPERVSTGAVRIASPTSRRESTPRFPGENWYHHRSNDMGETERLAALRRYRILDTKPEQAFDDLTLLASHICDTPFALITLVDADRQWFKARFGIAFTQTSRSISFCSHAIEQTGLYHRARRLAAREVSRQPDGDLRAADPLLRWRAARDTDGLPSERFA